MVLRFGFLLICAFSFWAGNAHAQEYIKPTWPALVEALIRMRALDMTDQELLDEYGIVAECDLYDTFYGDDFKWNKVRKALRQSIKVNIATYPLTFRHDIEMQLDRYDFTTRTFRFTDKSTPKNDNVIPLYSVGAYLCTHVNKITNIPFNYAAVLREPLFLEGLPMGEKDAKTLLVRMERKQNYDRIIYASYNLRVLYIEPLHKTIGLYGTPHYEQTKQKESTVRLDAQLDSIDFYEDKQHTKLIYQYQP